MTGKPVVAERVRKCRTTIACCGYCGGLIRLGEQEGYLDRSWQHLACIRKQAELAQEAEIRPNPDPEMTWSQVYAVTKPGEEARKLAFARYLREHGKPVANG